MFPKVTIWRKMMPARTNSSRTSTVCPEHREKFYMKSLVKLGVAGLVSIAVLHPAGAQQLSNEGYQTNVNLALLPIAELEFVGGNLLYLLIPPSDSTVPGSGVEFVVTGNADATLIAEPDEFVLVGSQYMGKAVLGAEAVGYKLELRFPDTGAPGSPPNPQLAALPGYIAGPTTPPLTVDLASTQMERTGVLHMEADPNWTPHGGIPLPGIYVGEVTLTLTPSD